MEDASAAVAPVAHRPWSTLLLALGVAGGVPGVAGVVLGIVWLIAEGASTAESPDAYGVVLGPVLALVGLVGVCTAVGFTVATARGRRYADAGSPGLLRGSAIAAIPLAVVGAFLLLFVMPGVALLWLVACIVVAVMVLVTTRATPPPGGRVPLA